MEPTFLNRFKHSKEMYIEINYKQVFFNPIISAVVLIIGYSAIAFSVYYFLYEILYAVLIEILGLFFALYTPLRIHFLASKREKIFMELYGKIPEGQTLFFDDHIYSFSETDKSEINIDYTKIKKIKQSKNLYLLILNNKIVVMVDKNRFEKGNCDEFEKFIREKAINAKIKL